MPDWRLPTADPDLLGMVIDELTQQVATGPDFESVTGVDVLQLIQYSNDAIATLLYRENQREEQTPMEVLLVRVFVLGFTVGQRYGQQQTHEGET